MCMYSKGHFHSHFYNETTFQVGTNWCVYRMQCYHGYCLLGLLTPANPIKGRTDTLTLAWAWTKQHPGSRKSNKVTVQLLTELLNSTNECSLLMMCLVTASWLLSARSWCRSRWSRRVIYSFHFCSCVFGFVKIRGKKQTPPSTTLLKEFHSQLAPVAHVMKQEAAF